jgi:hypothetical protein
MSIQTILLIATPKNKKKDVIWLTKEQSEHYKKVLKETPVLPDPTNTDEHKRSKIKSGHARSESKYVQEFKPWAEYSEKRGHARAEEPKFSGIHTESKSSHSSAKPVNISIEKYGVLGGFSMFRPTNKAIVIVDPAGEPFLKNYSKGASGASAAIYEYLDYPDFPDELRNGFQPFDARYHEYETAKGSVRVIHTVGPNGADKSKREFDKFMLPGLTETYKNVFKEFIKCGKQTLRLLLVSGGVYSGENDISTVTYEAIRAALEKLSSHDLATLGDKNIEMCLFNSDQEVYDAHKALCSSFGLCPSLAGGRKTVKRRRSPRSSPPRSGRSRTRSRSRF